MNKKQDLLKMTLKDNIFPLETNIFILSKTAVN